MSEDLPTVLHRFLAEERAAAATGAPDPHAEYRVLARRIGRRRAVRSGAIGLGSAAAISMLAVGAHALQRPDPQLPATPSPTITTTPSPSPSTPAPSATATPESTAVEPEGASTRTGDLAAAVPMPAGMLATTDDLWNLVQFSAWDGDGADPARSAALYLLAPDGTTYTVPAPFDLEGWVLVDWRPGTGRALLSTWTETGTETRLVDLEQETTLRILPGLATSSSGNPAVEFVTDGTGDLLMADGPTDAQVVRRTDEQGTLQAQIPAFAIGDGPGGWLTSPDGSTLLTTDVTGPRAYRVSDLTQLTLTTPYPDRPDACRAWTWTSQSEVLLQCMNDGAETFDQFEMSTEFWVTPIDGGAPTQLVGMPTADRLGGAWRVDGRLVVGIYGASETEPSWWESTPTGLVPLSAGGWNWVNVLEVRGGEILLTEFSYERSAAEPWSALVALDPFTGDRRTLLVTPPVDIGSLGIAPAGQVEMSAYEAGD